MSTCRHSNPNDKYILDVTNYNFIKEIKRGGYGVINLVQNKIDNKKYAAKTNYDKNSKQNRFYISRELRILIQAQHPTIIQFRGFSYIDFNKEKNITIFMDYMKNKSLADLIEMETKGLSPKDYNNTKRQIILIGVARGMMILHELHIIHRDLKPENILLDDNLHPHITDFGLSKFFNPYHSMNQSFSKIGTDTYMAPEVVLSDHFNTKADVYPFGIVMYELLTGKRVYSNFSKNKKLPKIEDGMMKKSLKVMIEKCLSQDPKERPTFSEIYKKLSLSNEDSFFQFENNFETNVIDYEEEESNEDDGFDDINKTFCLNSVDYDEILDYVDEINVNSKPLNQTEKESALEKEVESLKEKVKQDSETHIKYLKVLNKEIKSLKQEAKKQESKNEEFENMKKEIKSLNQEVMKQELKNVEFESMKKEIKILKNEAMKQKLKNEEFENMKKEIMILKEKTSNQETIISSLKEELERVKNDNTNMKDHIMSLKKQVNDKVDKNIFDEKITQLYDFIKKQKKSPSIENTILFSDFTNTDGILNFYDSGVNISAGGKSNPDFPISNIRNGYDYFINYFDYRPNSESDSFIMFDFGPTKMIDLHSYLIQSNNSVPSLNCHPKSWRIEGSNDNKNWKCIDRQVNNNSLNGRYKQNNFVCRRDENENNKFRYIRYVQEDSWLKGAPYLIFIVHFELYGDVYSNTI